MIDLDTPRTVFHAHHIVCGPCRELFAFARSRGDRDALDAWRRQLAVHLATERERREYEKRVRRAYWARLERATEEPQDDDNARPSWMEQPFSRSSTQANSLGTQRASRVQIRPSVIRPTPWV